VIEAPAAAEPRALPLSELLLQAALALRAVEAGRSLDAALAEVPPAARPGVQALAFHVLRWLGSARALRRRLVARKPPPALDGLLTCALALLWPAGELPYRDHVLVDQAVRAARSLGNGGALVNAVLRRFVRERDALVAELQRDDPVARWNHPPWWIARLRRDWPLECEALLAADNTHPPLTLRVNARRTDVPACLARLAAAGIAARRVGPQAVALETPLPVTRIPGFADGEVSVQDAAAQLAAPLLLGVDRMARGARVLDACAAPGGKTAHLLELADVEVVAVDRDATRLQRVRGTLDRLRLGARLVAADAAEPGAWWDGLPFDAILLDAPCSASGIVRRHPDVRWLRRESDIAALAQTQARLLDALWPLLAPEGRLLYCTCSVFRTEGEDQIDAFLQRLGAGAAVRRLASPGHLLPLADNAMVGAAAPAGEPAHDGFFYAMLEKGSPR
jgi:16S rRNA (cytosine967-C5)-methyltransferase